MTAQFESCGAHRYRADFFVCGLDRIGQVRPDPALAAIGDPGDRGFTLELHQLRAIEARSSHAALLVYMLDERALPEHRIRCVGRVVHLLEVADGSAAEIEICRHCAGIDDLASVGMVPVFRAGSSVREIVALVGIGLISTFDSQLWWATTDQQRQLLERHRLVPVTTTPEGTPR